MHKYVVFDLDETLGYFTLLGIFWDSLLTILQYPLKQTDFNELCDIYPEMFRPGIFLILNYLNKMKKKMSDSNDKILVVIYTNNQGPKSWTYMIKNYIETRLKNNTFFDKIICAYKVQDKQVEMCRTTYNKTIDDLKRCTKAPDDSMFIFFDDQYHDKMHNNLVDYINIKPYIYQLSYAKMINTFIDSSIGKRLVELYKNYHDIDSINNFKISIMNEMNRFNYSIPYKQSIVNNTYRVDKIVTKQMMLHLQSFFSSDNDYSKNKKKLNKTKKFRRYNPLKLSRKKR